MSEKRERQGSERERETDEFLQVMMAEARGPGEGFSERNMSQLSFLFAPFDRPDETGVTERKQVAGSEEDGVLGVEPHPDEIQKVDV